MSRKPRITTTKTTYTFDYPPALEFAKKQNSVFWTEHEIRVDKDVQDILVNMTEAEKHGVLTVLKLFTLYELNVGNEYWGEKVKKWFPRPEIQKMASAFSFFELNVHAPFYDKINEALNLKTDEFYTSYTKDPILSSRMEFIDGCLSSNDKLFSLGVFSMVEGAILYSNFAYLKHFQSQGKNKLKNIVAGINFSVRDENIHAEGGAWLFRTLMSEMNLSEEDKAKTYDAIFEAALKIREHEHQIVDMIFSKGKVEGITDVQMKNFVDSRINLCLKNIDCPHRIETSDYNPIASWFYKGINSFVFHDFFAVQGREYNRNWSETEFTWKAN